jgi:tetratricopeptide (TPR) repeat protein
MKRVLMLSMVLILVVAGCAANKPLTGPEKIAEKKSIAENSPNNEWCWFYLGLAYDENGQYREAIQAYNKAASKPRPLRYIDEWSLYTKMSIAYEALGDFDAAISAQKRSIELNPERPGCFTVLSTLYVENRQYDDAIATAKQVLATEPDNVLALNHLAVSYQAKKQYLEALKAAKRAIEVDPKQPLHYRALGRVLYDQNAYEEMAAAYKKGIEAAPAPDLYGGLAMAYYAMGQYDAALSAVNQAVDLLSVIDGVGVSFIYNGDYPVITEVMSISPAKKAGLQVGDQVRRIGGYDIGKWGSEQDLLNIINETDAAKVLFKVRRNGVEIETVFAKGTTLMAASAPWVALRSLIYRQKNDPARAFADASMALEIDPASEPGKIALGAACLDQGRYGEAVKQLQSVKGNTSARLLEATAFAKQGKMKEAIEVSSSIHAGDISAKNIPQTSDRKVLFQVFKPFVKEHRDRARLFESKGQYREALFEYSAALRAADENEAADILGVCFGMVRKNPALSEMPEAALKYAIRGEVLVTEGSFEKASLELKKAIQAAPYAGQLYYNIALVYAELKNYPEAIHNMRIYQVAAPDASNARAAKNEIIKWEFMIEQRR